ncbi:efflux RND transporter periplasmic adaptor subunit [Fulvivirgaceae bacterium PWU5]|uniref:Efflux RND transporter periplasmic adaptor subunit n=1 Tax=Dawidia cretensis TaxID=2782350 RepID=A0AAP2DUR3_9BACT|nr:efflux RND transporter periplasmic adaptor subunit [Dawidia cretensis]MBT1707815.1 efflux RND transporter periplasmic adaptor subunit [Dawidia cretensis]
MKRLLNPLATTGVTMLGSMALVAILNSCTSSSGNDGGMMQMPTPTLPVLTVANIATTTHREYAATLEGKVNVEIRPQVAGYLETIFIDEGEYVKAGQPLFRINDRPYREQVANTTASLKAAQANESKAQLEVDRLTPLVKNNVISEIQLQTAQASLESAKANVAQARAQMGNAEINAGYALIKAPVSGYIGHIPYKLGSLVGRGEDLPLTVLSDVKDIYAYFSLSEVDFLQFKEQVPGATLEEKLKNLPPVNLILADNTVYPEKGVVSTVEGQFDKTMGAITFRATFPNAAGLLRSGNTGRVSIPRNHAQALVVPQEATFELQDKVLVFVVSDSNKVASRPIHIKDQSATYYFVDEGLKPGEKIVYSGLSRLRDGALIAPQHITLDSLLKTKPI